jgi:hypothetical protein
MRTPHAAATGLDEIGLTWFLYRLDGDTTLAHGGGTNGQVSILGIYPTREFAVVVCANAMPGGGELIRETRNLAFRSYVGVEEAPAQSSFATATEVSRGTAQAAGCTSGAVSRLVLPKVAVFVVPDRLGADEMGLDRREDTAAAPHPVDLTLPHVAPARHSQ